MKKLLPIRKMKYTVQRLDDPRVNIQFQDSRSYNFFIAPKEDVEFPVLVEEYPSVTNLVKGHHGIMATPSGSPSVITISDDTSGAIVGSPPIELVASNGTPQSYATQATTNESSIQSVQPLLATSIHTLATSVATTCSTISVRISESLIPSAMILDSDLTTVLDMMHKVDATYLRLDALYTFLRSLSYDQVIQKGNLNNYNTEKRTGQVFSFDIIDKSNSDIVVTSFDLAATSYYNQIQLGKTYTIKGGTLRPAKKDYNNSTTPWDIILDLDSSVKLSTNQSVNIPQYLFHFKTIAKINSTPAKSTIDLLAVALSITAPSTIRKSDSTFSHKRTVVLSDNSALCIEATLWGAFSDNEGKLLSELCATQTSIRPVLAIKRAKTTTFKGTTLATGPNTQIFIDPDIPEAHALRAWFTLLASTTAYPSVSIGKIEKTDIAGIKSSLQLGLTQIEKNAKARLSGKVLKKKKDLKKTDGTKKGKLIDVPKLDANQAGGKNSDQCTLILTEGDSAKALAVALSLSYQVAGISIFWEATTHQQMENKEIEPSAQAEHLDCLAILVEIYEEDEVEQMQYEKVNVHKDSSGSACPTMDLVNVYVPTLEGAEDIYTEVINSILLKVMRVINVINDWKSYTDKVGADLRDECDEMINLVNILVKSDRYVSDANKEVTNILEEIRQM
ncbi:hypothetical protein KI387_012436 [Taxus chinensis]|uniref:DNA topoisomerase (ATP-hydrolyzing) n=1 Tax=Taxus chinensis TaxID=29808 RepID=A0AA38CL05_TAXCH|nr:hypothetical protein KI387_012436 [Taxus chinensis]